MTVVDHVRGHAQRVVVARIQSFRVLVALHGVFKVLVREVLVAAQRVGVGCPSVKLQGPLEEPDGRLVLLRPASLLHPPCPQMLSEVYKDHVYEDRNLRVMDVNQELVIQIRFTWFVLS